MQTTAHAEEVVKTSGRFVVRQLVICDQRQSLRTESGRVLKTQIEIELSLFSFTIIPLLAGDLAGSTANAPGNVD
jgi:hypothetical protein